MISNVKPIEERLAFPSFICKECQLHADEKSRDFFGITMYGCSNVAVYVPSQEEWEKEILPIYGSNGLYLIEQSGNLLTPQINPQYFETKPGEKWIAEKLLPKLDPAIAVKGTLVLIPWETADSVPFRFLFLGNSELSWFYDITLGYVSVTILDRDISPFFTQRNKVWGMTSPENFL
jgi:hypothetical protein